MILQEEDAISNADLHCFRLEDARKEQEESKVAPVRIGRYRPVRHGIHNLGSHHFYLISSSSPPLKSEFTDWVSCSLGVRRGRRRQVEIVGDTDRRIWSVFAGIPGDET